MPITTGELSSFLKDNEKKMHRSTANLDKKSLFREWVNVSTRKEMSFEDRDIEDMGPIQMVPQGAAAPEMRIGEGFPQKYTQHFYGGLVEITEAMLEFDMYGLMDRLLEQLTLAEWKAMEELFTFYLVYGSTALASVPVVGGLPVINPIGADGVTLFNTAHTWKTSSETWSNKFAAWAELTEDAVDSAYQLCAGWTTSDGAPMDISLQKLIVHPSRYTKALKVLKSLKEPATDSNAINTARELMQNLSVVVNRRLTTASTYFFKTSAKETGINAFFGWRGKTNSESQHPRTGNKCVRISTAVAHGANSAQDLIEVAA